MNYFYNITLASQPHINSSSKYFCTYCISSKIFAVGNLSQHQYPAGCSTHSSHIVVLLLPYSHLTALHISAIHDIYCLSYLLPHFLLWYIILYHFRRTYFVTLNFLRYFFSIYKSPSYHTPFLTFYLLLYNPLSLFLYHL